MNNLELKELGPPETYDNTLLSLAAQCPRRLYWFLRRVVPSKRPPYFIWGQALGVGLNEWHSLQGKENEEKRILLALRAARLEWEKDPPEEQLSEGDPNSWENLSECLQLYAEAYGPEERWVPTYGKGEIGFSFPIEGTTVSYGGSIDQPIEWPGYGKMIREDKSTGGYITPSYMASWDFSTQVAGYLWAYSQILGEPPYGALMNVISKRKRKEPSLRFGRKLIEYSQFQLDQFIRDTVLLIDAIRREWDRWIWPMLGRRNPIICAGGMGRSPCEYRSLCLLESEPWDLEDGEVLSSGEFILRPEWEPWARDGKNE